MKKILIVIGLVLIVLLFLFLNSKICTENDFTNLEKAVVTMAGYSERQQVINHYCEEKECWVCLVGE